MAAQMVLDAALLPSRAILSAYHYLGPATRGETFHDADGVIVYGPPTSRRLPRRWIEISRWCLTGGPNAGSRQWARFWRAVVEDQPEVTTFVSYSDPSVGHTGALYRACNWLWAPTWLRLRPPPSGNGRWTGERMEAVKDRWVFPVLPDDEREGILRPNDDAIQRRMPWACYREPRLRRGQLVRGTGGADYKRWAAHAG